MKKLTIFTMQLKTPGGIERLVTTLAEMFSQDYQVEIIANYGKPTDPLAFPLANNIKVTFLSPRQPAEISMKHLIVSFRWHHIPAELRRRYHINRERNQVFRKACGELQTDYIITDRALYNRLVGKFYHGSAKKIATDHNFHQNNHKYIRELLKSLKGFDAFVVATKELRDFYAPRLPRLKCYYIPNPLPYIPTKKSTLNTKNLLAIGRFVPEKDFATLIDAIAEIHAQDPDVRLTLIGDGPERPQITAKIAEHRLQDVVTLTGFLPQDQIKQYYYNSLLFVMTSKTEAFGLVLAEAMSYGLPCIALNRASGARAQIKDKKTGFLVHTPEQMALTIIKLLQSPAKLHLYQKRINQVIATYSKEHIIKAWHQILN